MLNFGFEQGTVNLSDSKGDARLDEVTQELSSVDLVSEFDKSVQLFFQLWLERVKPELVRDEPCDALVGKEHC